MTDPREVKFIFELGSEVFGKTDVQTFHWADYLVFALSLAISLAIGIYFAVTGDRQRTTEEFLLAGRNAGVFPVAMSAIASFISAVYIISIPAEIMYNGTMFSMQFIGYLIFISFGAHTFIPFFHKRGKISAYEYLQDRFNFPVRFFGVLLFTGMMILFLSIVLRGPAIAFANVMDVDYKWLVVGLGILCTIYTTIGGLKAVLWTDTFQMSIVIIGIFVLMIAGADDAGGFSKVWDIADKNGRLEFDNISGDPRERHTMWTQTFGAALTYVSLLGANQTIIQRYISVKKIWHAQVAAYAMWILAVIILFVVTMLGLCMFANFYDCDPLTTQKVSVVDEVMPVYMMKIIGDWHGVPGLFTASVFAASLSSVSSALNSLAAVFLEDLIKPFRSMFSKHKTLKDETATIISKGLSVLFGLICIGLSFVDTGESLVQISLTIFGTAGGPLVGMFILGMFFTFTESWGTLSGGIVSTILVFWLNGGAESIGVQPIPKTVRIDGCPYRNITVGELAISKNLSTVAFFNTFDIAPRENGLHEFYRTSYMWYGALAVVSCVLTGLVVSGIISYAFYKEPLRDRSLYFMIFDDWHCFVSRRGQSDQKEDIEDIEIAEDTNNGEQNLAYL